jgi:pimeloyl-ACP methyl ester carboxylesterase
MSLTRRIFSTRYGQVHVRSSHGAGRPMLLLHSSGRSGQMWERFQAVSGRATHAVDRLGYGFSDAPPWALTMEQYAQCTLDALTACGVEDEFDVLGVHSGSLEAIEIAQQAPLRVKRVGLIGVPLFNSRERARALAKHADQTLRPVEGGDHLALAWRAQFAYRQPPYDFGDVQERLLEFLLAPNAGADYRAVCGYEAEKRLKNFKLPLTVFAPHDDLLEQTVRARELIEGHGTYVDLPGQSVGVLHEDLDVMIELLNRHLPM